MSITSIELIIALLLAPMILRNQQYKKYVFFIMNMILYFLACGTYQSFLGSLLWIVVPYIYCHFFKKKTPLFLCMTILFLYLNRYDWIFQSLHIPYMIPFMIFGLSYIVFRQIDYVLGYEFYHDDEKHFIDYINYILSFYTIICGPIQSYQYFYEDFYVKKEDFTQRQILDCFNRIANGFIKISLISYYLHKFADEAFASFSSQFQLLPFIIFMVCNVWFIYFNFSGYCDVVNGAAKLAGFDLPENFHQPFLARDISDFWNRQHITLTKWITNYIFTPIVKKMMERFSIDLSQYIGFFVAFLIAGLWHGTTMNYLIYGILQAIGVCLTKLYTTYMTKKLGGKKAFRLYRQQKHVKVIEIIVTQIYIYISFIFIGYDIIGLL